MNLKEKDIIGTKNNVCGIMRKSSKFHFLMSITLTSVGLILIINQNWMFDQLVKYLTAVGTSSEATSRWSRSEKPIKMFMYFYNWTNPHDLYDRNIKPKFEEVGPYVFKEMKEKKGVMFHDNQTVSYSASSTYEEDMETSRSFSDVITSLNYAAATKSKDSSLWEKNILSSYLTFVSSVMIRKTVRELMFEGYDDPILDTINIFPASVTGVEAPPKFGWLYGTNGSTGDTVFNMGITKDENYGKLYSFNQNFKNPYFDGKCSDIRGTTAELFPTNRKREKQYFFHYELCRSLILSYDKDKELKGLNGYQYVLGPENFDNGTISPENVCWCNGECLPVGVMNLTSCRKDNPIFFSLPHFYTADPYYLQLLEGLHPLKEKHEFTMTIEPKTGVIMHVNGRIQLNILLRPNYDFRIFDHIPELMFPIFWFQQNYTISDEVAGKLSLLLKVPIISLIFSIFLISIGIILGIIGIFNFYRVPIIKM